MDSQYLQRVKELEQSFNNSGSLARIADVLPEKLDGDSRLENSMHAFLIAASAGLSCSAIFGHGGFDTHVNHDERMTNDASPLTALNNRVDFLWEKAKELGLDDRLVVYITSDVGRRPFYNNNGGKDHWHVSSDIIMKKNVLWTNKVVGASGAKHELLTMNKDLTLNENSDLLIRPGHVHLTLRNILGIDSHKHSKTYDIKNDEEFPLLHEAEHTDYL